MTTDDYINRIKTMWHADLVPAVRAWQAGYGPGEDAGIVDIDLDQDDVMRLIWTVHLRSGVSRQFVLDLALH